MIIYFHLVREFVIINVRLTMKLLVFLFKYLKKIPILQTHLFEGRCSCNIKFRFEIKIVKEQS